MNADEVMAKHAITEVLYRYCRSLDRMDEDLYATVFQTDASLDYGELFLGTPDQFRVWVWKAHEGMQAHSHQITNVLAEVDLEGGRAVSESYVTVCLRTKPDADGATVDIVDRGRYLDRWTRHSDGSWRIVGRRHRSDINHVVDASSAPPASVRRDRTDPSYELFA